MIKKKKTTQQHCKLFWQSEIYHSWILLRIFVQHLPLICIDITVSIPHRHKGVSNLKSLEARWYCDSIPQSFEAQ